MADLLDRGESQSISRDEYFRVCNKASNLIDSSSICVRSLNDEEAQLDGNCEDILRNSKTMAISNSIIKSDLKKINDLELTSGVYLFNNKDHAENNSVKTSLTNKFNRSFNENDVLNNKKLCITETTASPSMPSNQHDCSSVFNSSSDSFIKNGDITDDDIDELEINDSKCYEIPYSSHLEESSSQDSNSTDNCMLINDETQLKKNMLASTDFLCVSFNVDSQSVSADILEPCDTMLESDSDINSCSTDSKDNKRTDTLSDDVNVDCVVEEKSRANIVNPNSFHFNSDDTDNTGNIICTNESEDITIEIMTEPDDILNENLDSKEKNICEESLNIEIIKIESLAGKIDKSESFQVLSMKEMDSSQSDLHSSDSESVIESAYVEAEIEIKNEEIHFSESIIEESCPSNTTQDIEAQIVLDDKDIYQINVESKEITECKTDEQTLTSEMEKESSKNIIVKADADSSKKCSEQSVNSFKDHCSSTNNDDATIVKTDIANIKLDKSLPQSFKNSKCTIQLVPKVGEKSCKDESKTDGVRKMKSDGGMSERLESLMGTVKIGCLSVTPLNPSYAPNEVKENLKKSSETKMDVESLKEDSNKKNNSKAGSETTGANQKKNETPKNVPSLLKPNKKLIKNNVEITISPKTSETNLLNYSDSAETLKVKIPQLIDSCTGKSVEKHHLKKEENNKNFIVNKNLKVIESFLMQKGFQREATILKEKTDIIKPYLEDIALKLEKNINEKSCTKLLTDNKDATDLSKFMNDLNKNSVVPDQERSVERELAALTEKFLNSSAVNAKQNLKKYEEYLGHGRYPSGSLDKSRVYDRYYGKQYCESLDYLSKKEISSYLHRGKDQQLSGVYRSSRYDLRDYEYNIPSSDITMYDQFLPEFDNRMHSNLTSGISNFSSSDFSLFIDEYTAEKYNNFIHFMVPEFEAMSFDMMEYSNRIDELNQLATVQPLDCCYPPMMSPINPFFLTQGQYPMLPHSSIPMTPTMNPYSLHQSVSPAMGRPLPMDSSKESCSQLTITPLDECGKPYGSIPITDPCGQHFVCNETYPCSQSYPPGILPPISPLVPADALSQQLTITPLHQSSNLPYLHRSAVRRRGRPPMDPDYDVVGYRKDAYANARFSRADFLARVRNNVERSYETSSVRSEKFSDIGSYESKSIEPFINVFSLGESNVSPPPACTPVVSVSGIPVTSSVPPTPDSANAELTTSQTTSLSIKPLVSDSVQVSITATPVVSNGYKKSDPNNESKIPKYLNLASKQSNKLEQTSDPGKSPFQILSKQEKVKPNAFLPNSSVKIKLVDKKTQCENLNTNFRANKITDNKKLHDSAGMLSKSIPGLKSVLNNSNITFKTIQTLPPVVKKDIHKEKIEMSLSEKKKVSEVYKNYSVELMEKLIHAKRNLNEKSTNENISSEVPSKNILEDAQSYEPVTTTEFDSKITIDPESSAKKITPVKAKKRRRFPFLKKKKKRPKLTPKTPSEVKKKVVKPRKVVNSDKPVGNNNKSDTHTDNLDKTDKEISLNNVNLSSNSVKELDSINLDSTNDSLDKSGDGIRRSGRKRKIIEGNPKFRDMERVDLKYFREERLKPIPVKRKLDSRTSSSSTRHELIKKKVLSGQRTCHSREHKSIRPENKMPNFNASSGYEISHQKEDESKTKEKLQQFLEVNDIYLKPQTFV